MKPVRLLWLTTALLGMAMLWGCGPHRGTKIGSAPLESTGNLVYLDAALTTQIPCEHLSAERLPSGRLRVRASFFNEQNHTAECQLKIKFKDEGGQVVEDTGWMPLLLPRRESVDFDQTSLNDRASQYVVMLRKAKT